MATFFDAAWEGAELLFLLIIPVAGAIYALIGGLEFFGIWQPIQKGIGNILGTLLIDPANGIVSIFIAPTLAASQLLESAAKVAPPLVVGSFVLMSQGCRSA